MKNLVNINPDHLAKLEKARQLNQTPSWDWVTKNDLSSAPDQAEKPRSSKTSRPKK